MAHGAGTIAVTGFTFVIGIYSNKDHRYALTVRTAVQDLDFEHGSDLLSGESKKPVSEEMGCE